MGPASHNTMARKSRQPRPMLSQRSDSESSELASLCTWPPKTARVPSKRRSESLVRPQTATLERPRVLDSSYLGKLDMSLTRKALLSITNLCKQVPATKSTSRNRLQRRQASLDSNRSQTRETCNKKKLATVENKTPATPNLKGLKGAASPTSKTVSPRSIPEPCRSCGRPELPERLHSHPRTHTHRGTENKRPVPTVTLTRAVKSSVHRPVPIKFKSSKNKQKNIKIPVEGVKTNEKSPSQPQQSKGILKSPKSVNKTPITRSLSKGSPRTAVQGTSPRPTASPRPAPSPRQATSPRQAISPRSFVVVAEKNEKNKRSKSTTPRVSSAPHFLVCYLCGRQFGTASLPLHEPRCLEKWQRLNSHLPPSLQRTPPQKPAQSLSPDEWNEFAWRATQSQLSVCEKCGRTFLPDRLSIHRRSCKGVSIGTTTTLSPNASNPNTPASLTTGESGRLGGSARTPAVVCRFCGRNFGTRSIVIHEPQCEKRSRSEASAAPATSPRRSPQPPNTLTICYLCGRSFGSKSLPIHEPQCLRKWRQENEKLPVEKRRSEPRKPDTKLEAKPEVSEQDAQWQAHLETLVPCGICGRTFFPERLEVHERGCREKSLRR